VAVVYLDEIDRVKLFVIILTITLSQREKGQKAERRKLKGEGFGRG
jgi:hypothetical protein